MILRTIAFIVVILLFAVIAFSMFADLAHTEKKIDKHGKNNVIKTNLKRSNHH